MLFLSFYIHCQCLPSDIDRKDRDQKYTAWFKSLPKETSDYIYFLGTGVAKPTIQDAKYNTFIDVVI